MRSAIPILLLAASLIYMTMDCFAEDSAVIVIVDGFGSSYIYPGKVPSCLDGTPLNITDMWSLDDARVRCELRAPVPQTEYGHAVLFTGYKNASGEIVAYYDATIFDALRRSGYLNIAIMEKGDSNEVLAEQDIFVREKNNSVYSPCIEFNCSGDNVPQGLADMMEEYPSLTKSRSGKDRYGPYLKYNEWALSFASDVVAYMDKNEPGQKYLLTVNAGGVDSSGHSLGYDGYTATISGMDEHLQGLIDTCRETGTLLVLTGDHGMSFKYDGSRGSHSSFEVSSRDESVQVPLIIYSGCEYDLVQGIYGQESFAPTLLSLLGIPNTLSMCDGEPLPLVTSPSLFVRSQSPVNITVTGKNFQESATVSGIYCFGMLEKGVYTIHTGTTDKVVDLAHDELIDLGDEEMTTDIPDLAVYASAAAISVAGIMTALKLMRKVR